MCIRDRFLLQHAYESILQCTEQDYQNHLFSVPQEHGQYHFPHSRRLPDKRLLQKFPLFKEDVYKRQAKDNGLRKAIQKYCGLSEAVHDEAQLIDFIAS